MIQPTTPEELRFFTDEHIDKAIVDQLRQRGIDVLRCEDVGMKGAADNALLEYATEHQRTILSFDDDFERVHVEWMEASRNHCGIFRCLHHLQGSKGIGAIVTFISDYHALIQAGAGSLPNDVYNRVTYIR